MTNLSPPHARKVKVKLKCRRRRTRRLALYGLRLDNLVDELREDPRRKRLGEKISELNVRRHVVKLDNFPVNKIS